MSIKFIWLSHYGKVFPDLDHLQSSKLTKKWYEFRKYGYAKKLGDRHPRGTKSTEVAFVDAKGHNHYKYYKPAFSIYDIGSCEQQFDYIEARKKIYAPAYAELVKDTSSFRELQKLVAQGHAIQILDLDGPQDKNSEGLQSFPVTVEFLRSKINDPTAPFGNGYVLAGLIARISPEMYT